MKTNTCGQIITPSLPKQNKTGKRTKSVILWPQFGGGGGSGAKSDRLSRLSTYGFPMHLNILLSRKSNNKGDIRQKDNIC